MFISHIKRIQTSITTLCKSGPGSNDKEEVIPHYTSQEMRAPIYIYIYIYIYIRLYIFNAMEVCLRP